MSRRQLNLSLELMADVGLVGMPNAGKSSLLSTLSAARVKIADYPFTTLYPSLGVVKVGANSSFVMADIPGLLAGASQGAGLRLRFLKHIRRNRLLLHMVDSYAHATAAEMAESIEQIYHELVSFDSDLANKPRWLLFNKVDLLGADTTLIDEVVRRLKWQAPCFHVSAATGEGSRALCQAIIEYFSQLAQPETVVDQDSSLTTLSMP